MVGEGVDVSRTTNPAQAFFKVIDWAAPGVKGIYALDLFLTDAALETTTHGLFDQRRADLVNNVSGSVETRSSLTSRLNVKYLLPTSRSIYPTLMHFS